MTDKTTSERDANITIKWQTKLQVSEKPTQLNYKKNINERDTNITIKWQAKLQVSEVLT